MCLKLSIFTPMLILLLHFWGVKEFYHQVDVGYCSLRRVLTIHAQNIFIFLFPLYLLAEKKSEYSTALAMCANWIESQVTVCAPLSYLGNEKALRNTVKVTKEK